MRAGTGRHWLHFVLWAVAGASVAVGLLAVLTIGVFVLPAAAALIGVLAWRGDRRLAAPGILTGLGLLPLYVGYLNRGGPGMVCTGTAANGSCTQEMSPWPWIAVGLCLIAAGTAICVRQRRR